MHRKICSKIKQPADSWKYIKDNGAIVDNRVLSKINTEGVDKSGNKIRHGLADVKAARTV